MLKGSVLSVYTHRFQLMMTDMDSNQLRYCVMDRYPTGRYVPNHICITLDAADADD